MKDKVICMDVISTCLSLRCDWACCLNFRPQNTKEYTYMHNTEDVFQSLKLKQPGWHDTHNLVICNRCRWHPDKWNHSCRVCCHVIAPITEAIGEGEEGPSVVSVLVLPIKEEALCLQFVELLLLCHWSTYNVRKFPEGCSCWRRQKYLNSSLV